MGSLKKSTARGVRWTAVSTVTSAVLSPLILIVQARFLAPDEFAYIAAVVLVTGFLKKLEGSGFNDALIQKKGISVKEASSLCIFNLLITTILSVILVLSATLITKLFDLPGLAFYIQIMCIAFFVSGAGLFFEAYLKKELFFREIAIAGAMHTLVNLVLVSILLFNGWGLLGVFISMIVAAIIKTTLLIGWFTKKRIMKLKFYFSFVHVKPFFRFGIMVYLKQIFSYFNKHMDELTVAILLTPEILGIYYFGKKNLSKVYSLLHKSYSKVIYPVLTKANTTGERLASVYYKINRIKALVILPVFIMIALTAHLFVPVIFGNEWVSSVNVFQLFAIAYSIKIIFGGSSGYLLYAVNQVDKALVIDVVSSLFYFALLIIFGSLGLNAVLTVYLVFIIINVITYQYIAHLNIPKNLLNYLSLFKKSAFYTSIMATAVLILQTIFIGNSELLLLIGSLIIGGISYSLLNCFFNRNELDEIASIYFDR